MAKEAIVRCPHCGSTEGLYTNTTYVNVPWHFGFDGKPQHNGEMYDNAEKTVGGETAYCGSCHKAVCRMNRLRKQWGEGVFRLDKEMLEDCV